MCLKSTCIYKQVAEITSKDLKTADQPQSVFPDEIFATRPTSFYVLGLDESDLYKYNDRLFPLKLIQAFISISPLLLVFNNP